MDNETTYAFIDESGNIRDNILVVCGIVTNAPKLLEKRMKIIEKKTGKNTKDEEIKASKQQLKIRQKILQKIINLEFETYSIIFDLNTIKNRPYDFEEIYRFSMSLLCRDICLDYPEIEIILDKRYTSEYLRNKLNQSIVSTITAVVTKNALSKFYTRIHFQMPPCALQISSRMKPIKTIAAIQMSMI